MLIFPLQEKVDIFKLHFAILHQILVFRYAGIQCLFWYLGGESESRHFGNDLAKICAIHHNAYSHMFSGILFQFFFFESKI